MLAHPVDRNPLIFQSKILLFAIAKAKNIQAIVNSNEYNWFASFDRVGNNSSRIYTSVSADVSLSTFLHLPQTFEAAEQNVTICEPPIYVNEGIY